MICNYVLCSSSFMRSFLNVKQCSLLDYVHQRSSSMTTVYFPECNNYLSSSTNSDGLYLLHKNSNVFFNPLPRECLSRSLDTRIRTPYTTLNYSIDEHSRSPSLGGVPREPYLELLQNQSPHYRKGSFVLASMRNLKKNDQILLPCNRFIYHPRVSLLPTRCARDVQPNRFV